MRVLWMRATRVCVILHKKSWKTGVFSLVLSLTIMENFTILFKVGQNNQMIGDPAYAEKLGSGSAWTHR